MSSLASNISNLLHWYDQRARPYLNDLQLIPHDKLIEMDMDAKHLEQSLEKLDTELVVCFLGNSGVGKSTLLNAIINGDQPLVPSGGVGPLTAQAVVVQYADTPRLKAEYKNAVALRRTIFGLEQMYKAELGQPIVNEPELPNPEIDESVNEEINLGWDDSDSQTETQQNPARIEKREQWRRRAQLLVTGSQENERSPEYLIDSLREAIGQPRRWDTITRSEDKYQLRAIREIFQLLQDNPGFSFDTSNQVVFQDALHDHAVGFMAPMIKNLTVYWPSPLLQRGIILVDLPGVGISGDEHKEVTRYWIRERAKALVLVVDHRGMTEAVEQSLQRSEFLNNLLYSADEPDEDPVVIVAVTRVDDIANTKYLADRRKRKYEHFMDVTREIRARMRSDLQNQLNNIWLSSDQITEARKKVAENLMNTLRVHPISAPEYVRLLAEDEDDKSFLQNTKQSGVPDFVKSLQQLAAERNEVINRRVAERAILFHTRLLTQLQIIEAQWESTARADEKAKKLRNELTLFLEPRRNELLLRQGAFHSFLSSEVPQQIKSLVRIARTEASTSIVKYMGKLENTHWATLRASVVRGGIYNGSRDINLPNEFALRFEEPVANAWSKEILRDIRAHTRDYGKDCLALACEVKGWADRHSEGGEFKEATIQYEDLVTNAKKLESVGKDSAREMRDEVRAKLVPEIEKRIKQKCAEFVKQNRHVGSGVKHRILELYAELAEQATEIAEEPAKNLLQNVYRDAREDIKNASREFQDPLTPIANAIVATEQQRAEREDAKKRELVHVNLEAVLSEMPTMYKGSKPNQD